MEQLSESMNSVENRVVVEIEKETEEANTIPNPLSPRLTTGVAPRRRNWKKKARRCEANPNPSTPARSTAVSPRRLNRKRKARLTSEDRFVGQTVCGVLNDSFDAGFLLTVKVGDTDKVMHGFVFKEGLCVPVSNANDIAPNVKLIKRDERLTLASKRPRRKRRAKTVPAPSNPPSSLPTSVFIVNDQAQTSVSVHDDLVSHTEQPIDTIPTEAHSPPQPTDAITAEPDSSPQQVPTYAEPVESQTIAAAEPVESQTIAAEDVKQP